MTNILLVDDNRSIINALMEITDWESHGCTIAGCCYNGAEALEFIRKNSVDILITDMKMPIMGGLEATRKIRELNPIIPIIALTANAFDADRVSAMEAGCNAFLTKPLKKEELLELFSFKL